MADVLDRILELTPDVARRLPGTWQQAAAAAFRRDSTSYAFRFDDLLERLGIPCRSWASKARIPGKLALVADRKDAPAMGVLSDFLGRGGTVIVEHGIDVLHRLEIVSVVEAELAAGPVPVFGTAIDELAIPKERALFWADANVHTLTIPESIPLVACQQGPLVSKRAIAGGTLIWSALSITSYTREPMGNATITPAELATQLGLALAPTDPLASDEPLPRHLFHAELAMTQVFAHLCGAALR